MSTERFTCTVIEDDVRKGAIRVTHNGISAWIPRSQIERRVTDVKQRTELVIPTWLYNEKFER